MHDIDLRVPSRFFTDLDRVRGKFDSIEVALDRGVLAIAGERINDLPSESPKISVHGRERHSGKFRRTISLPDDIDPDQVRASYRDGVLHVPQRRRESVQPRHIEVRVG